MSKPALASKNYFRIIAVAPSGETELVTRKNGLTSFIHSRNARRLAHRLSRRNPKTRFYVVQAVAGFLSSTQTAKATY